MSDGMRSMIPLAGELGLQLHSAGLTWLAVLTAGSVGALLKELMVSVPRYRRTRVPPWREPGEDGVSIYGGRGYAALVLTEVVIGMGAAVAVALVPLVLEAGTAGLGATAVLSKLMEQA
jgi:hypothetical protein